MSTPEADARASLRRTLRMSASIAATAVLYTASAKLGLSLALIAEQVSAVWPPTGIALAIRLLLGPIAIPGIAIGAFVANVTANEPLATAAGIALGNTLEAVLAAWLLERVGFRRNFERLRDVMAFVVLAAMVSTMVSATIGVTSLCLGAVQPWSAFGSLWVTWWIGDALGDLVVAPLLLVWISSPPRHWSTARAIEAAALLVSTIVVSLAMFGAPFAPPMSDKLRPYQLFPLIVWSAVRFRQVGTVTITVLVAALAIWNTIHGRGPFVLETPHASLLMLQLFEAIAAITGLVLAAAICERDSALKRAATEYEHLRNSEERLRLALEAGHMGVWDWDIPSNELVWSPGLERVVGLEPRSSPRTMEEFMSFVHPEDRERVSDAIARALVEGDYEVELRNIDTLGEIHWSVAKGVVIRDQAGKPARMLGVAMDMTERRHLEDALRERASELARADERKDEFLAMLAHELRNPLAPLSNALHLLRLEGTERARFLDMADRQVRLLARLVDDLLDVSRITRGKITLRKEPVLVADVVAQAVETVRTEIESRAHVLTLSLPPQSLCLDADPARLAQVFANLLSNAAKYTPPRGSIWLTAEPIESEVMIRVRDNGVGISPDLLPHVFDLFVQADVSLERARGGLGIGLTVVRRLVEMHGGHVDAHSAGAGQGSEFIVHLPLSRTATAAAWSAPAESRLAAPLKVLVIEDNKDSAETLASILELWGHEVRLCFDGLGAVPAAELFEPDIILSDIGLPGLNGFEVARQLRQHPSFGKVVLVAMSGYGREEDKRRAMDAGFDHHLVKPPDLTALAELLGRVASSNAERPSHSIH